MSVLILASSSSIRATLLRNAGLDIRVEPARIDEDSLRDSLLGDGASPHDIADTLAEHKALRIAGRNPQSLVLGCDQILECEGRLYAKPATPDEAREQLRSLSGRTHRLHTAAVLFAGGQPVWRHVATPRLTFRTLSEAILDRYVAENWDAIRHSVGAYQIEGPGIRLVRSIEGDLFSVQGLPLLPLLDALITRKDIPG
jgi:septum formation protein